MKLGTIRQQPVEVKDYTIDYTDWLLVQKDSITNVETSVRDAPDSALKVNSANYSSNGVLLWISGGLDGSSYQLQVTITTTGGRVDQSELVIKIKEI
jgi:hypothetical protein